MGQDKNKLFKKKDEKFSRFLFTMLRPDSKKLGKLHGLTGCDLCFYGLEVGPIANVRHAQGYLEVKPGFERTMFQMKHELQCWVQPALHTRRANYEYCAKAGELMWVMSKSYNTLDLPDLNEVHAKALDKQKKIRYSIKHPTNPN